MSLCVGTHLIPHPNKVSAGFSTLPLTIFSQIECSLRLSYLSRVLELEGTHRREDAFFVSGYSGGVIAVADGVSGYGLRIWD